MHDIRMQVIYLTLKVFSHFGELSCALKTKADMESWKSICGAGVQSPVLRIGNMKIWQQQFRDQCVRCNICHSWTSPTKMQRVTMAAIIFNIFFPTTTLCMHFFQTKRLWQRGIILYFHIHSNKYTEPAYYFIHTN